MNELQKYCENRLKSVLIKDKKENPKFVINVLKSDILCLLSNYMDIKSEDLNLDIIVLENGTYKLMLEAFSKRIKVARKI